MKFLAAILRVHQAVASRLRNGWFRALGVRITGYVWMRRCSIPQNWGDITLDAGASLDDLVTLLAVGEPAPNKIVIGTGTYVNRGTILDAALHIEIGRHCMIGPHCYITDHDHGHELGRHISAQPLVSEPVKIHDDVWIGAGVIVLKGVTIGPNAIVGAGSVVTRDVASGDIMAGVPARVIGRRQ
jgi:carbonic anhydrase/acetyltransferase-like protein (isoleucine patch superfamily)